MASGLGTPGSGESERPRVEGMDIDQTAGPSTSMDFDPKITFSYEDDATGFKAVDMISVRELHFNNIIII